MSTISVVASYTSLHTTLDVRLVNPSPTHTSQLRRSPLAASIKCAAISPSPTSQSTTNILNTNQTQLCIRQQADQCIGCLYRWLASNGQNQAAEQALRSLRGPEQIEAEMAEMQEAAETECKSQSWALLRSPVVRGELHVGECLHQLWILAVL